MQAVAQGAQGDLAGDGSGVCEGDGGSAGTGGKANAAGVSGEVDVWDEEAEALEDVAGLEKHEGAG